MNVTRDDQRGSVLIIAIIAMMIMGILSISFALLARVEVAIGVNYKSQAQAEALAEAGLERARDVVRGADAEPCGFTRWTDSASGSYTGCGSYVSPPTETLGAGSYTFVIDNDCPPLVPDTVKLKDSQCGGAGVTQPYPTSGVNRDSNQMAIVTAWATTSTANAQGRARVRAILGIDNPWRHVCASSSQDHPPGYCNEPANRNGNPTITPSDPNEYPGGPQAYDDLPRPQLGCSEIDPSVHGAGATMALGIANCLAWEFSPCWLVTCSAQGPSFKNYPYPNPGSGGSAPPRLVVTGDRGTPSRPTNCDGPGPGGTPQYQGYFDCALSTPCDPAVFNSTICAGGSPVRKACVKAGDPRAVGPTAALYVEVNPVTGCGANTGMVVRGINLDWNTNYVPGGAGLGSNGVPVYVMRGTAAPWTDTGCCYFQIQSQDLHAVVVVEGDGLGPAPGPDPNCSGANRDLRHKNGSRIWTKSSNGVNGTPLYGYPLAYLLYDPVAAVLNAPQPQANPLNQQNTCADMGSASGTEIHGITYSGGNVEFNPVAVDGGVISFQIQTQSSSAVYGYSNMYGDAAPPAGFPTEQGNQVVVIKKSFVVCGNYAAGSGTACE